MCPLSAALSTRCVCAGRRSVPDPPLQLIDISEDGFCSLLLNGDTKDDLRLPEGDLGNDIRTAFDEGRETLVQVVSAMGEEHILGFKVAST